VTPARRSLLDVLQRTTTSAVAARCRCSKTRVSRWASGESIPSKRLQEALHTQYGIDPAGWAPALVRRRVIR
jgi:transcriptional regulator with XRE-family HTH domain